MKAQRVTLPNREQAEAFALDVLAGPPSFPFTERHPAAGELVLRWVLPLELCRPQNTAERHRPVYLHAEDRKALLAIMMGQVGREYDSLERRGFPVRIRSNRDGIVFAFASPLPGRPCIRAIRFSAQDTDAEANFAKLPIDLLMPTRVRTLKGRKRVVEGLGLIRDDKRSAVDSRQWCERAPRGAGFVLFDVWTGGLKQCRT